MNKATASFQDTDNLEDTKSVLEALEGFAEAVDQNLNWDLMRHMLKDYTNLTRNIRRNEARYRTLIAALSEGLVMQESDGRIVAYNQSACDILGLTPDQLRGRTSTDPRWKAVHEDGSPFPGQEHPAMVTLSNGKPLQDVVMGVHKIDGSLTWISINSRPVFGNNSEKPQAVVTTFTDITDKLTYQRKLEHESTTDPLTGLANRAKFTVEIEAALGRSRHTKSSLSVIMFDIDKFKTINDTYGHDSGDLVLKRIAEISMVSVRSSDVVARWGGEEFLILLPRASLEISIHLAERLRTKIQDEEFDRVGQVTASFGVATFHPRENSEALVKRADEALYRAKRMGRNRVEKAS